MLELWRTPAIHGRLGFVTYQRLETIEAGPQLELGIDGERMVAFIRSRVLGRFLAEHDGSSETTATVTPLEPSTRDRIVDALHRAPEGLSVADLERLLGTARSQLKTALGYLRRDGQIERQGPPSSARYKLVSRG